MSTNNDGVHRHDHHGTGPLPAPDDWFDIDAPPAPAPVPERPGHYRSWLQTTDRSTSAAAPELALAEPDSPEADEPLRDGGGHRVWTWIFATGAVGAAVAAGVFVFAPFRSPDLTPTVVTALPGPTAVMATVSACPPSPGLPQFDGQGAGSTRSGPEVVLALEHGYYVERTAAAVRTVLVADGPFGTDAEIQSGIDDIPVGTTHCVQIAAAGPERWAVTITEHRPAGSTVVLHQLITTTVRENRTLVAAVTPA
ncbi:MULTISPECIES: hypothetical protein [Nocardia]|uniref:DUF8176 domain-containing protein n=1 Tax=Nocardia africana TaxID=134964 RepID=A0A378WHF8_9NOCA|nr:hypothetical protein [Nocardia africana]MCC3317986.1 hypothetical protein [Nocardia africana]SUA40710.1 Uncharacterised protein [Nocardia africana]